MDIVYRDDDFTLLQKGGTPYLMAGGRRFMLGCHPYEPCLHITADDGSTTLVHNAFNPIDLLEVFRDGRCVSSITGRRYSARDFCRMVQFAAGKGELGIDDAESVFEECPTVAALIIDKTSLVKEDPALELLRHYPDLVPEYYLVKVADGKAGKPGVPGPGREEAHRAALELASHALMDGDEESEPWHYDIALARAHRISIEELFAREAVAGSASQGDIDKCTYRKAFLDPSYGGEYTEADFDRVNAALFPCGEERLEAYEWNTDWSDFFADGDGRNALCLTVYDPALDRFVVILSSAT